MAGTVTAKQARHLQILENEIEKANAIITSLLDFAQGRPTKREPRHIKDILREAIHRSELPRDVKLEMSIPGDLPPVYVDHHQIVQVFFNLLTNASQAVNRRGRITIAAQLAGEDVCASKRSTGSEYSNPCSRPRQWE
jgi:nitrogen-specific signal transduction histidine kinase